MTQRRPLVRFRSEGAAPRDPVPRGRVFDRKMRYENVYADRVFWLMITSRIGDRGRMPNSGSARKQQRLKIEEITRTLAECGFVTLDKQAYVLGLSRSTAWTIIRGTHKTSGLSATTINRMLATGRLPLRVRLKVLEYIAEKMSGAYGDRKHCLKAFASRISPVHMHAALFRGAKPDAAQETDVPLPRNADVTRRFSRSPPRAARANSSPAQTMGRPNRETGSSG